MSTTKHITEVPPEVGELVEHLNELFKDHRMEVVLSVLMTLTNHLVEIAPPEVKAEIVESVMDVIDDMIKHHKLASQVEIATTIPKDTH